MHTLSLPPNDRAETPTMALAPSVPSGPLVPAPSADDTQPEDPANLTTTVRSFRGIAIGTDTVTEATKDLPENQRDAIRWLHAHARNQNWTMADLERETGIGRNLAWKAMKGEYKHSDWLYRVPGDKATRYANPNAGKPISLDGFCQKVERAKQKFQKLMENFSADFMLTEVWQKVEWGCLEALNKNRMVFIYGESYIGKTRSAQEFARQHNSGQSTYVRVPPAGGVHLLLKEIAAKIHVNSNKAFDALLTDVVRALDVTKLLIVDEVHEIFETYGRANRLRCLEMLRYIHDISRCGMVLIGTRIFRDEIENTAGEFYKFLGQHRRRGLYTVQLPQVPCRRDVTMALDRVGLEWPRSKKTEDILIHLAQDGLGVVLTFLDAGRGLAKKKGQTYSWEHFLAAQDILRDMQLVQNETEALAALREVA